MIGLGFNNADTPVSLAIDLFSNTDKTHTATHCFLFRTDNGGEVIESYSGAGVCKEKLIDIEQAPARRNIVLYIQPADLHLEAAWAWADAAIGRGYDWRINAEDAIVLRAPYLRWLFRLVNRIAPSRRQNCVALVVNALKAAHAPGSDRLHEFLAPVDVQRWTEQHGWMPRTVALSA